MRMPKFLHDKKFRYGSVSVALTVLACIWMGQKADAFFDIAPKGTIAGIFLGFPVAIYSIYHQVRMHFGKKEDGD